VSTVQAKLIVYHPMLHTAYVWRVLLSTLPSPMV